MIDRELIFAMQYNENPLKMKTVKDLNIPISLNINRLSSEG